MKTKIRTFVSVLKLELEDSLEDFHTLMEFYERRGRDGRLTEYVSRENAAVVHQEISGLRSVLKRFEAVDPARFHTLDEAESFVIAFFRKEISTHAYPQALLPFIERKIAKVKSFMEDSGSLEPGLTSL